MKIVYDVPPGHVTTSAASRGRPRVRTAPHTSRQLAWGGGVGWHAMCSCCGGRLVTYNVSIPGSGVTVMARHVDAYHEYRAGHPRHACMCHHAVRTDCKPPVRKSNIKIRTIQSVDESCQWYLGIDLAHTSTCSVFISVFLPYFPQKRLSWVGGLEPWASRWAGGGRQAADGILHRAHVQLSVSRA